MRRNMKKAIAVTMSVSMMMSLVTMPVNVDAAKRIKLSKKSITLAIGKSSTIKIKNIKAQKIKKFTVKSSKKKIATVKKNSKKKLSFKVKAKAEGSAKIWVKIYLRGQKKAKKLRLKVKVASTTYLTEAPTTESVVAPTVTAVVTAPAGGTAKPIEFVTSTVRPTATTKATESTGETKEPVGSPAQTVVPMVSVSPTVTSTENPSSEPVISAAPTVKPTENSSLEPVVTPKVTEPVSETMKPTESVEPVTSLEPSASVAPTMEPTATPDTLQLDSVMVTENRKLMIFFNEPSSILKEDLVIKTKNTEQDSYGEALAIESIEKIDSFQYEVVLASTSGNYIVNNGYAQVLVERTSGKTLVAQDQFECEFVTTTREWFQCFTVGNDVGNSVINLKNEDFVGTLQYEVTGDMPDGVSYLLLGKSLCERGTPEKVGIYKVVVDITDEVGNNLVYNCTYLVGGTQNLYAVATQQYALVGEEKKASVIASGGSGTYTYTKVEGAYEFTVDSGGKVIAEFSEPGTY